LGWGPVSAVEPSPMSVTFCVALTPLPLTPVLLGVPAESLLA
jgi:hypothetical protein